MLINKTAVIIGRWQIPHNGHMTLINEALKYENAVIVVGSSYKARSAKNPFTHQERIDMLTLLIPEERRSSVKFLPVRDYGNDDKWNVAVTTGVESLFPDSKKVLVGFVKDHTSYYLNNFGHWESTRVDQEVDIHATDLRAQYFESDNTGIALIILKAYIPVQIFEYLQSWSFTPAFRLMKADFEACREHRRIFTDHTNYAGEALVTAGEYVLLIKRDKPIGHGQWAIPGGVVHDRERGIDAAIRNLREKTKLGVLDQFLRARVVSTHVFDAPDRSQKGRYVSSVTHIELGNLNSLPEVFGDSQASNAFWIKAADIPKNESMFFEDHSLIIDHFLKVF